MKMHKETYSIDVSTQLLDEVNVNDSRFWKIKIWLMHLGQNLNGTIFTRESVINAIPSLANTPIMAKVDETYFGSKDFQGHEIDVELTETEDIKIVNATTPFGVIPETNNAQLEKRICDDMVEREFLTVEGLLWSKWDGAIDVLLNKNGITGQSMEITEMKLGKAQGDYSVIDSFKFNGACLLGDHVMPAMTGSTAELKFTTEDAAEIIKQKLAEYSQAVFAKGGNTLSKEDKTFELEQEDGLEVNEDVGAEEEGADAKAVNQDEGQGSKAKNPAPVAKNEEQDEEEEEKEVKPKEAKDQVVVDEVSIEEIAKGRAKDKEEAEKLPQPKDLVVVRGVEFSVKDIENLLDKLAANEAEFTAFKKEIHKEKVAELFETYAADLDASDIETLKAKADELSVEELQTQIFAVLGKKSFESNKQKEATFSISKGIGIPKSETKPTNTIDDIMASFK